MKTHFTVRLVPAVSVLLGWAVGATLFFRRPIFTGFSAITGDSGDTRLIIYLHEHWLQVLRGLDSWRNPGFFHPAVDTSGYADTFILNEVFYAPLRWCGMDPFLAYQVTLVLLSLVGYLGAYQLLSRILSRQRILRAALATVFAFSNMLYVQAGHTQLFAVYWIPFILVLLMRIGRNPGQAAGSAFLAGLAIGLLFLSTFYVAWFFVLTAVLWCFARWMLWRPGTTDRRFLGPGRKVVRRFRREVLSLVVGAAVGGIPFLLVYLPNFGSSRSFDVVSGYAAQPLDIFNTGSRNWLWGPLTRTAFGSSPRIRNGELGFGLTPILLVTLVGATGYLIRRFLTDVGDRQLIGTALATAVTCWSAIVLPMKVFGLSLWYSVWLLVPGGRAIRAIDRIGVIAALLAPLVIAFVIADLLRRTTSTPVARKRMLAGIAAVTVALTVEQFNVGRNAGLDRSAEVAALQLVPDPPANCRVFYVVGADSPAALAYVSSIDAMLISQTLTARGTRLPTINGFAGQFPPGFGEAADPGSSGYQEAVRSWITRHGLTDVCSYDQARRQWAAVATG